MSFIESPRFPEDISYGATGGPRYRTDVVVVNSGAEKSNINWDQARAEYDVVHGVKNQAQMDILIAYFRAMKGRAHGFRFKDFSDFKVPLSLGKIGTGLGAGLASYQLNKNYAAGSLFELRAIKKPLSGTSLLYRNSALMVAGSAAGNYSLDTTTGIISFVADGSANASSIAVGATTTVVLASNPGLAAGQFLHLSGFTGVDAGLVNNLGHTINSVTGSTFVLATNTLGKTITLGSGAGKKFFQASDVLTWEGEFDIPCRFDTDEMKVSIEAYNVFSWGQIPVIEIRI